MHEGYEQPPSENGQRPWWDKNRGGTPGEGVLIAFLALANFLILGGVIWGFLAASPLWVQAVGVAASAPGTLFLARSFVGAARVIVGNDVAVGIAWQRLVHGSALLGGGLVVSVVLSMIVIIDR